MSKLKLVRDDWEDMYDNGIVAEYRNEVTGFEPYMSGDDVVSTLTVFITVDKVLKEKGIWMIEDGKKGSLGELLSGELYEQVIHLVRSSVFYRGLSYAEANTSA